VSATTPKVEQDHTCEATHCVVCCPVYRAWSDGYGDAKSLYGPVPVPSGDAIAGALFVGLALAIIVGVVIYKHEHNRA
jgi:hypothetical protein